MLDAHLRRVAHRRQVVGSVPLGQQGQVSVQALIDLGGQAASEVGAPRPVKPLSRLFFRCTSSSEMAAGVTEGSGPGAAAELEADEIEVGP